MQPLDTLDSFEILDWCGYYAKNGPARRSPTTRWLIGFYQIGQAEQWATQSLVSAAQNWMACLLHWWMLVEPLGIEDRFVDDLPARLDEYPQTFIAEPIQILTRCAQQVCYGEFRADNWRGHRWLPCALVKPLHHLSAWLVTRARAGRIQEALYAESSALLSIR